MYPDKRRVEQDFLRWWLIALEPHLALLSSSNTQENLSAERIRRLRIALPALDQQLAIAHFLDHETAKIEALIQAKERTLRLNDEKLQSTIYAAVSGRLSASASIPAPAALRWAERIPADWQVCRLKTLARVQSGVALGRTFDGINTKRVPYVRVANVQDGYLDLSDVAEIEVPEGEVSRYALQAGDLLMNEGGDFDKLGRGAIWPGEIDPCIHQNHVFAVRPDQREDGSWLELFNRSTIARHYFILRSKQSTNLASVSSSNLRSLPVLWPPRVERLRLLAIVRQTTAEIESMTDRTRRSIDLLHEHRSALIAAAVTGQMDVRNSVRTGFATKENS